VVYLGANLPAADIVAAATQVGATAVALSVVYADGDATLRELRRTAEGLPGGVTLLVGGMAAGRLERSLGDEKIRVLGDLASLRETLRELSQTPDVPRP
jgi:methylmalonyl-CoA mutase cobalamin-binding subunit